MENKVSTKSLLKLHETVITSLSHAVEQGWIGENPAECVNPCVKDSQILFTAFLQNWLKMMKTTVKLTTYSGYAQAINNKIVPYFDEHYPGLDETDLLEVFADTFLLAVIHKTKEFGDPFPEISDITKQLCFDYITALTNTLP